MSALQSALSDPAQSAAEILASVPVERRAELAGQPWYIVQACVQCGLTVAEARVHLGLDEPANRVRRY